MSSSSKPKTSQSPTRVLRSQTTTARVTTSHFADQMLDKREHAALQLDLKAAQANEENLKNLLMGLNVKMTAYVDQKQDLKQSQAMLAQSEAARADLQSHIQAVADKVAADCAAHRRHHDQLSETVAARDAALQAMREEAARAESAHLAELNDAHARHHSEKTALNARLREREAAHAYIVEQMSRDFEQLRVGKDAELLALTQSREQQRAQFEARILALEAAARERETTIRVQESRILELEATLERKRDV